MTVLYVASDRVRAGKTAMCITLAAKLIGQGGKSTAVKPFTSTKDDTDSDVTSYTQLLECEADGWPIAISGNDVSDDDISKAKVIVDSASEGADVVLVEAPNGLSVEAHARISESLGARVLVLVSYHDGMRASDLARWSKAIGERLAGFVINNTSRYLGHDVETKLIPSMRDSGLTCFGIVPEDRVLLSSSVSEVVSYLNAEVIVEGDESDPLVEHLMAWGFSLDPGQLVFEARESKALVIRGDRPDIQMAALATPTSCLIATQGKQPIEYVLYEAGEEDVTVMTVLDDTLSTMDTLGGLMDTAAFNHPDKVARFGKLLDEHIDVAAIIG